MVWLFAGSGMVCKRVVTSAAEVGGWGCPLLGPPSALPTDYDSHARTWGGGCAVMVGAGGADGVVGEGVSTWKKAANSFTMVSWSGGGGAEADSEPVRRCA